MDPEQAAQSFLELFHEVFMRFHERQPPAERELSREAWGVIEHLSRTGPLTVTEAAQHFERSQAAMSEILMRLERRALLVRFPDERDRRRTLVWLSEEGVARWRQSQRPLSRERLAGAFGAMNVRERKSTITVLRRLLKDPASQTKET